MISPQWLRSFVVLAERGSFTRTADQLGLTQAAVSQHIRHLEETLGPLLIRRPRQIELTPAGQALLMYCADLEQAEKRLNLRLSGEDDRQGEISLISPGSIGLSLYPLLLDLQALYPGLTMRHRFAPDHDVLKAVGNNDFELGLVTIKPDDPRLAACLFAQEPLDLVVPAKVMVSCWEDLENLGFIDHPDGQAMASRLLSRVFPGNRGIRSIACKGFVNQIGLILDPVARGFGFTVLPRYAREAYAWPDAIRVVEMDPRVVDSLWLIYRAQWTLSARARFVASELASRLTGKTLELV
ncbi:MAG: LysR family transcriptional regulator [Alcanivorax borkumensis]|jgi:DNA-binding transcriptional LysR family regulator|uniref:Transcriptional regulator, LysR family n=1 Tax=Alcanivorax borkumensis (strain ATCC 700651 / DSM 11573 / NCIMB 13689 / SK2) TaxID=393595 RepID=Q0VLS3_ALCBS|nr:MULTISPECIES: LysR family transcriptional regulator [Alcanivorax]OJH07347.1 MAG: LysR family transcriptional regulator [Alcanivorax borkumensis]EUC68729.1 LysR family transcriptional regulator [Alcanivorax sp. 97CO-5]PKG00793.1 LysR family transcriptional regulator [Alcanivorax sp. 97CO-6]CAL17875.1 transcriptional regulator, LysR family [Alcanivorax borkumensis SK2]BAP15338.1 LysR family transcriptional regulator [Alcanivorax sp. NBRC 101098]